MIIQQKKIIEQEKEKERESVQGFYCLDCHFIYALI